MSDSYTSPDSPPMPVTPAGSDGPAQAAPETPETSERGDTVNADAEIIDVEILEQEQQTRSYEVHQEGALTYFQYFLEDDNDVISPGGDGSWRADYGTSPRSFISAGAVGVGVIAATFGAGLLVAEATNRNAANQEAKGNALERLSQDGDNNLDAGNAAAIAQGSAPESLTPDWSNSPTFLETEKSATGLGTDSGSLLSDSPDLGEAAARIAAAKSEIASPAASAATAMMAPMATSPPISPPSWRTSALAASPALALASPSATLTALPTPVTSVPAAFPEPNSSPSTWVQSDRPSPQPVALPAPSTQPIVSGAMASGVRVSGAAGSGSRAQQSGNGVTPSVDEQALRDRLAALREREASSGNAPSYQRPVSREDLATPESVQAASNLAPQAGTTLDNVFSPPDEGAESTVPLALAPLPRPSLSPAGHVSAPRVNHVAAPVAGLLPVTLQPERQPLSPTSRQLTSPSWAAPRSGDAGPQARARALNQASSVHAPEYSPAIELSVIPAEAPALPWQLISSLEQLRLDEETTQGTPLQSPPAGLSRQVAAAASQNPAQLSQFRLVSLPAEDYRQLWQRSLMGHQGLDRPESGTASPQGDQVLGDRPIPAHGFVDYHHRSIVLLSPSAASAADTAEALGQVRPSSLKERNLELASTQSL